MLSSSDVNSQVHEIWMTSFPYDLLFASTRMRVHSVNKQEPCKPTCFPLTELGSNIHIELGCTDVLRSHFQLCPVINTCVLHGLSLLKGSVMYRTILSCVGACAVHTIHV